MILRNKLQEDSAEVLDLLIGAALRESVAGVEPSPHIWERIKERVEEQSPIKRAKFAITWRVICRDVIGWLWRESVLSPAQPAYYNKAQSGRAMREENYLCSLAYQCELLMRLAKAS